ncbi:DUF3889 domain-containing protein [Scopulibacillus cellulosilyticus]|uniref:DUF3889 domain-containing protein n=1 Tax=Scopulibacillus cellulosilyticus TaxID=2665665 RepID=A0ABW2Q5R9_9BACL
MKALFKCALPFIITCCFFVLSFPNEAYLQTDYAKWGKIALEKTKERYPDSNVSDYAYMGHEKIADNVAADWFEFQLKRDGKTKSLKVRVTYSSETDKLIDINFFELEQPEGS